MEKEKTKELVVGKAEVETKAVQVIDVPRNTISKPLVSTQEAKKAWQEYQDLASAICTADDVQEIGGEQFKKKSFWRKIDKFFGLSLLLISEREEVKNVLIRKREEVRTSKKGEEYKKKITEVEYYSVDTTPELGNDEVLKKALVFKVVYRATAPNGQYMDGDGACDTWEKGYPNSLHDTRATAHTRAKNRAISDLAGFGEISAEEADHSSRGYEDKPNKPVGNVGPVKKEIEEELKSSVFDNDRSSWEERMKDIKTEASLKGMLKRVQRERKDREVAQTEEKKAVKGTGYTVSGPGGGRLFIEPDVKTEGNLSEGG